VWLAIRPCCLPSFGSIGVTCEDCLSQVGRQSEPATFR